MTGIKTLTLIALFLLSACSNALSQPGPITDFESCLAAGNKVLRIYPPKCVAPGVGTFTKQVKAPAGSEVPQVSEPLIYKDSCLNKCGDGECSEMVCMAVGCPCAENRQTCPQDCK